jgi:hypothetical protein
MGRKLKQVIAATLIFSVALISLTTLGCKDVLLGDIIRDVREANRTLYPDIRLVVDSEDKSSGSSVHIGTTGQNNPVTKTFYIFNDGEAVLNLPSLVEIAGVDEALFTVVTPPPGTVKVGEQESFVVEFESSVLGTKTATLTIENNDPDESSFELTITGECVAPGTVIAPNGGELLKPGSSFNIAWSAFPAGNVTVDLYSGGAKQQTVAADIPDSSPFAWSVPTNIDDTDYKIRITSIDDGSLWDESDGTFSIGRLSNLTIAGADGYYKPGESLNLSWATTLKSSEAVTIALYRGGTKQQNLASGVLNDGSQTVQIPASGYSGSGYTLRVFADGNSAIYADTGSFYIGAITVTVPSNSGIVWYRGTSHDITWNTGSLGGNVAISYLKGTAETSIDGSEPNIGSYTWNIPAGLTPGNDYKIKITFSGDTGISDTSNNTFTVQGEALAAPSFNLATGYYTANQSVTMTAPSGASICYTTDGATPDPGVHGTSSSPKTITVSASETTVKAISVRDFYDSSSVAQRTYYIPYKHAGTVGSGAGKGNYLLDSPRGVCFHNDSIYVADAGNDRVIYYSTGLVYAGQWDTTGTPYDIGSDGSGYVWVSENSPDAVRMYSSSGADQGIAATGMGGAWGVYLQSGAYLYVVDFQNNQVRRHTHTTGLPFHSYLDQNGFTDPIDIDRLRIRHGVFPPYTYTTYYFVSDAGTGINKVRKYDASGNYISQFGGFNWPKGIACIDGNDPFPGYVIVADAQHHRVSKFDSNGTFVTQFGSLGTNDGQFSHPEGVAVDNLGNIYVTDNNGHRLQKFTPN